MEAKKIPGKARMALGRGLGSLISVPVMVKDSPETGEKSAPATPAVNKVDIIAPTERKGDSPISDPVISQGVRYVDINLIGNNPKQPRYEFKEAELKELSDSIKQLGVLQPILVRPLKEGRFEIVAGERRWRAAQAVSVGQVPVIIKDLDDRATLEIALVENIQRQNLNPIEEARGYERLMTEFSLTQAEVADRVGKDRVSIANYLRLLKLPLEVLKQVEEGTLSLGHAKVILAIKEPSAQASLARKVISEGLTVRALEAIVSRVVVLDAGKRLSNKETSSVIESSTDAGPFPEVVERLRRALGTKVTIRHLRSGKGRIEIQYFSDQELDRMVDTICAGK